MRRIFFAFVSLTFLSLLPPALAQGTAFDFQGQLDVNGSKANGNYDMVFTLFNTNANGVVIAGPLTNSATAVSNGLFSVTLDFGSSVFTGNSLWLDISVSPSGSNTFVELTPRQTILPTPYAIYSANAAKATVAASAASISASNINGTVSAAQLPGTVLTNGAISVNLAGTFSGNGSGLTGVNGAVPWQIVSGTNVQAASNTGYMLTNNSPVTVVLPLSPNPGDIVRISCPGGSGWKVVENAGQTILNNIEFQFNWTPKFNLNLDDAAQSADGSKVVGSDPSGEILTSTNFGATWTIQAGAPSETWVGVASSADGTKLVAVAYLAGIYTSTNSGVTWVDETNAPTPGWTGVASSADGAKLAAAGFDEDGSGAIYTSTNSGMTWVEHADTVDEGDEWQSIVSSADGTKLAALSFYNNSQSGYIYTSTNSGVTWVEQSNAPNANWVSIASSADGTKLAAIGNNLVYTSTDSGVTWVNRPVTPFGYYDSIASSAGGMRLVIAASVDGQIVTSKDGGISWAVQQNAPSTNAGGESLDWYLVYSSADGTKLLALIPPSQGGGITVTVPTGNLTGEPNSAVELQYVGNGRFMPISYTGGITGL